MEFHGEDDGSVSWMEEELELAEKQHQLWMKEFEDKERRRKQEYADKLAEIDEAEARDTEDLEQEYVARKKAIRSQFESTIAHQCATDPQTMDFPSEPPLATVTRLQDDVVPMSCVNPNKPHVVKVAPVVALEQTIVVPPGGQRGTEWFRSVVVDSADLVSRFSLKRLSSNEGFHCAVGFAISRSRDYSPTTEVSLSLPGSPTNTRKPLTNKISDEGKNLHSRRALCDVYLIDLMYDAKTQGAMFGNDDVDHSSGGGVLLTTIPVVIDPGGKVPDSKRIWLRCRRFPMIPTSKVLRRANIFSLSYTIPTSCSKQKGFGNGVPCAFVVV